MDTNKYNPPAIREAFKFLVDEFHYKITREEKLYHGQREYGYVIDYLGNNRRVHLSHDYKENFFYFSVIRGITTRYPNDHDQENIVSFWKLFKSFKPTLELKTLQPEGQTCADAALINAKLLKKYASKILRGEEWII